MRGWAEVGSTVADHDTLKQWTRLQSEGKSGGTNYILVTSCYVLRTT